MSTANRLVVEIGSGDRPDSRSDILVDKFPSGRAERAGSLLRDRPLVIADGEALPFRSGAFSYVIARHVLEHASDPGAFIAEMQRVGHAGYIETPTPIAERLFNWPYHRWFVDLRDGVLVLREKTEQDVQFGHFFHNLVEAHLSVRLFMRRHAELFFVSLDWQGSIAYRFDSEAVRSESSFDDHMARLDKEQAAALARIRLRPAGTGPLAQLLRSSKNLRFRLERSRVRRRHRHQDMAEVLRSVLCCPRCKDAGDLETSGAAYRCIRCDACYPIRAGVPVFNANNPKDEDQS